MKTLIIIVSVIIAICSQLQYANAGVLNRTDQYHIIPIPVEDLDNLRAARQQVASNPEVSVTLSPLVANNVAQILTGLFNEDVTPIVQGGTSFIPVGGLREGVQALLHDLSPLLQNVLFGPYQPPSQPQQSPASTVSPSPPSASPPTHIQIVIQLNSDSKSNQSIAETTTLPPTTTPVPTATTEHPETATIILKYRISPKPTTTPLPPQTPERLTTTKNPRPSQILLYFRHPNESYTRLPQSSHIPDSANIHAHLPDSPMLGIMNIDNYNALLPESPMASVIKHIIETNQFELLKQVDEEVITPIATTEKQYIYLVLQNEEYEEFVKFTSNNRMPIQSQSQLSEISVSTGNNDPPQQKQVTTIGSLVSNQYQPSTNSPNIPNLPATTIGSTTQDPDPRQKEDEDDDDDDRISITDIIDAVISRRS